MTDDQHLDAALSAVYLHRAMTGHPLRFYASLLRLEYVCRKCGEVLYEGPTYTDGIDEWQSWQAPKKRPHLKRRTSH